MLHRARALTAANFVENKEVIMCQTHNNEKKKLCFISVSLLFKTNTFLAIVEGS